MLDNLKHILNIETRYYLIGIRSMNSVYEYELLIVSIFNSDLKIIERQSFQDIENLFVGISKDYPIIIHLEGDKIISKETENKKGYRNNLIFNADINDFYFYENFSQQKIFVSITRKDIIDNLISEFNSRNKYIIHFAFGPFVLANLIPILPNETKLTSFQYQLNIANNSIESFLKNDASYKDFDVNGEIIKQNELVLIATLLDYKFPNSYTEFNTNFLASNRSEQKFQTRFKVFGVFMLAFVLIALFVGHLLLNFYSKSLAEKESLYVISQQFEIKAHNLKEELSLKKTILKTSGVINKEYYTKYIIDFGNTVFPSIVLKSFDINPVEKKIKKNEKITFAQGTLLIKGESKNDSSFNEWVNIVKDLEWVLKLDILDFSEDRDGVNTFYLKVSL